MDSRGKLEVDILDQLANDFDSFAILHTELVRVYGYDASLPADDVIEALKRMLENGWITLRTPEALSEKDWRRARALYLDWLRTPSGDIRVPRGTSYCVEEGPDFLITERGRSEWKRRQAEVPNS